jgi:hypothetical protein
MKSKISFLFLLVLAFALMSSAVFGGSEDRAFIKGLHPMSMGGAFVAVADDENAFFYNPAGIITERDSCSVSILSIDAALLTDTSDLYNFYKKNKDDINNWNKLSDQQKVDLANRVINNVLDKPASIWVSAPDISFINKPIAVKQNSLNFGVGLFCYADASAQFKRGAVLPHLLYNVQITGIGIIPVAYKINSLEAVKIPGSLSVGTNFKYMYRRKNSQDKVSLDEIQKYKFQDAFLEGKAFGMDFGMIYSLNSRWNFGLDVTDIFTTCVKYKNIYKASTDYGKRVQESIKPNLGLGVAYRPERFYYWVGRHFNTNSRLTFVFDITDLTGTEESFVESPFKKIHFGTECKLNPFVIRAGFDSGYPTVGFGIVTNIVNLEYAFYGEEHGRYAGQNSMWFHRVELSFKIGSGKSKKTNTKEQKKITLDTANNSKS